jgi:hypothetical protein
MNSMSVIDLRVTNYTVVTVDTMDSNMVYCPKG